MSKAGVTLTGDWRKLNSLVRKLNTTREFLERLILVEAERVRREIILEIQDYQDIPNADATVTRKGFNNPLVESGTFGSMEGVIIEETHVSARKVYYTIKGNPNAYNERTGMDYESLANLLEYGTSGKNAIPARPIFTITLDRMEHEFVSGLIYNLRNHYSRM